MERALKKAAEQFEREREKLSEQDKQNTELWLHLLWSKLYRALGVLPPIRPLEEYQDKRELESQKTRLEEASEHLQKGLWHLKRYNLMLKRIRRKARVTDALTLVHSVNQEGILNNRVTIVQLRIYRLKQILMDWQKQKLKKQKRSKQAERETKRLRKIRALQVDMKKTPKATSQSSRKSGSFVPGCTD